MSPYLNAKSVLPPGLLAEIQRHVCGHLWVPVAERQAEVTQRRVVQLQLAGVGTREIAELVGISQRRVQQIVRKAKHTGSGHAE